MQARPFFRLILALILSLALLAGCVTGGSTHPSTADLTATAGAQIFHTQLTAMVSETSLTPQPPQSP